MLGRCTQPYHDCVRIETVSMRQTLSVPCPVCGALRGELCRNPTLDQINRGLPPGEVYTGHNRGRVHDSRVEHLEYVKTLRSLGLPTPERFTR